MILLRIEGFFCVRGVSGIRIVVMTKRVFSGYAFCIVDAVWFGDIAGLRALKPMRNWMEWQSLCDDLLFPITAHRVFHFH
jgi:hypothetical protein